MEGLHVGLIPDGNRRWARAAGVGYTDAYQLLFERVILLIDSIMGQGIEMLSIYALSAENLQRTDGSPDCLLEALETVMTERFAPRATKGGLSIRFVGLDNIEGREEFKESARGLESTCTEGGLVVNLLVGYSPWSEALSAFHSGGLSVESLAVPKPVDLILRTGGGPCRLSNFLPLQSGYAAIATFDQCFLDVPLEMLTAAISDFSRADLRYGR